jgi:hypothetical protein
MLTDESAGPARISKANVAGNALNLEFARERYVLVPFAVTGRVNALETSPTTRLLLGAQSFHCQQALEPWSKTARFAKSGRNTDNRRSCCGKYGHGPGRPLWPSKPPWLEASAASGS